MGRTHNLAEKTEVDGTHFIWYENVSPLEIIGEMLITTGDDKGTKC